MAKWCMQSHKNYAKTRMSKEIGREKSWQITTRDREINGRDHVATWTASLRTIHGAQTPFDRLDSRSCTFSQIRSEYPSLTNHIWRYNLILFAVGNSSIWSMAVSYVSRRSGVDRAVAKNIGSKLKRIFWFTAEIPNAQKTEWIVKPTRFKINLAGVNLSTH